VPFPDNCPAGPPLNATLISAVPTKNVNLDGSLLCIHVTATVSERSCDRWMDMGHWWNEEKELLLCVEKPMPESRCSQHVPQGLNCERIWDSAVRNWRLTDLVHSRGCSWHNISFLLWCKQIFLRAESDLSLIHGPRRGRGGNRSSVDLVVTRLWAGRSRVWIPVRTRELSVVHNIHTGCGAHSTDAVYTRNANITTPRLSRYLSGVCSTVRSCR